MTLPLGQPNDWHFQIKQGIGGTLADFHRRGRVINWRLLGATCVILAVAVPGSFEWNEYQRRLQVEPLLEAAEAAEASGDWVLAADLFRRFLAARPERGDVMVRAAVAIDKADPAGRQRSRTITAYSRALSAAPDRADLRARLAEIQLAPNPARALDAANRALADDPDQRLALKVRARALDTLVQEGVLKDRNLVDVTIAYEKALERNPGDVEITARLAALLRRHTADIARAKSLAVDDVASEADRIVDEMVENDPRNVSARLIRHLYRIEFFPGTAGDEKDVSTDVTIALRESPDNPYANLAAAEDILRKALVPGSLTGSLADATRARLRKAVEYLRVAQVSLPSDPRPYLGLAWAQWELGESYDAVATLEYARQKLGPKDPRILTRLASAKIALADWRGASQSLNELDMLMPALKEDRESTTTFDTYRVMLQLLRAQWYLGADNPDRDTLRAADDLRKLSFTSVPKDLQATIDFQLGQCQLSAGQWERSVDTFKSVCRREPESFRATVLLGTALSRLGEQAAASAQFDKALAIPRERMTITERLAAWQDYCRTLIAAQVGSPVDKRDWSAVDGALERLRSEFPTTWTADLIEAEAILARRGVEGRAKAGEILARATQKFRYDPNFQLACFHLYLSMGAFSDAKNALVEWKKRSGRQSIELDAKLALAMGDEAKLRSILAELGESAAARLGPILHAAQAELALRDGRLTEARASLAKAIAEDPSSWAYWVQLAQLAFEQGDATELKRLEDGLLGREDEAGAVRRLCRSLRLLAEARSAPAGSSECSAKLTTAHLTADELLGMRPDWPLAYYVKGLIAEARGDNREAIACYQRTTRLGDRSAVVAQRLVTLLLLDGQIEAARRQIDSRPDGVDMSSLLAPLAVETALATKAYDKAVAIAQGIAARRRDDSEAARLLGKALLRRGGPRDNLAAKECFRRSIELRAASLPAIISYLHVCVTTADPDGASDGAVALCQAGELFECFPGSAMKGAYAAAVLADLVGDLKAAENYYLRVIGRGQREPLVDRVPPSAHLSAVIGRPTLPPTPDAMGKLPGRAAITLAVLAEAGAVGSDLKGLGSLFKDDPRWLAVVAVRKGGVERRLAAIDRLAGMSWDDWRRGDALLLARLYRLSGELDLAFEQYEAMTMLQPPAAPPALQELFEFALAEKRPDLAKLAAERWEQSGKGPLPLVAQVRLLVATDRGNEALGLLREYLAAEQRAARDVVRASETALGAAAQAGLLANVLPIVAPLLEASKDPRAGLVLADARGRLPEGEAAAMQWLVAHANENVRAAALAAEILSRSEKPDSAAFEPAFAAHLADPARAGILVPSLAKLREKQGKAEEAASITTKFHVARPRDPVLANNLALILAKEGKFDDARRLIDSVIASRGPDAGFLDTKGQVLWRAGKLLDASRLFQASALDPEAAPSSRGRLEAVDKAIAADSPAPDGVVATDAGR